MPRMQGTIVSTPVDILSIKTGLRRGFQGPTEIRIRMQQRTGPIAAHAGGADAHPSRLKHRDTAEAQLGHS